MSYFKFMGHEIFYEEFGMGDPLIFLHGNASSSDVFKPIIDLYKDDFKVVLIDFLGYGKSEQINTFPLDIWAYEAAQVLELIHIKDYRDVKLVGMSGGAIVAVNIALKEPGRIHKIIADNFQGESSSPQFLNRSHLSVESYFPVYRENLTSEEFMEKNGTQQWLMKPMQS